jgi:hypothetical protein
MALSSECEVHEWFWDPTDDMGCPVCHGIQTERERGLSILERKQSEMIDAPNGVLSINDLNDLIDEIAFSDRVEFDGKKE